MARITRLKAAPVPFPNGGALQAMATKKTAVYNAQRAALKAKHDQEAAELEFKISEDRKKSLGKGSQNGGGQKAQTSRTA